MRLNASDPNRAYNWARSSRSPCEKAGNLIAADYSSVRLGSAPTDLDERLTRRKQGLDVRPRVAENLAEKRIARIPTREPI